MTAPTVASLHIYPIKSCQQVALDSAVVGRHGLVGDRLWQVIDAEGVPVTQRQAAVLATVRPEPQGDSWRVHAPGHGELTIGAPGAPDTECRSLVGDRIRLADAGAAAAEWFSDLVGQRCRLVGHDDAFDRRLPPAIDVFGAPLNLSDAAPVLVVNEASHADLAGRAGEPFGIDRFRANIVVRGAGAWAEDTWARFRIGAAELGYGLPWPRCAIPQVDQDSGDRRREPAVVLKAHRWCTELGPYPEALRGLLVGKALFGAACTIGPAGTTVAVGDAVEVLETAPALLAPPR
ncbi:MAG: MOSC domain-containing protein [Acidimicrobiia bacterium]|nr:MOSC domain-containing protein [Acidimicrobiia bacterium]